MSRTAAARVLGLLIGAAIVAVVLMTLMAPTIGAAHLLRYRLGTTDREIVVTSARGYCDRVTEVLVREDASSVRVTVRVARPRGTCPASIVFDEIPMTLASALGGREITDADGVSLPLADR